MGVGALVGVVLIVAGVRRGRRPVVHARRAPSGDGCCVAFVLAQLTNVAQAVSVLGSVSTAVAVRPTHRPRAGQRLHRVGGRHGGTTATIIRYFQRRGLAVSVAVSSGVLVSLANMAIQAVAVRGVVPAVTRSSFTYAFNRVLGERQQLVGLGHDLAAGADRGRPGRGRRGHRRPAVPPPGHRQAQAPGRRGPDQPARAGRRSRRKLVRLFGGAVVAQVLFALVLGASLHAYGLGERSCTASLLGGIAAGMGVIEPDSSPASRSLPARGHRARDGTPDLGYGAVHRRPGLADRRCSPRRRRIPNAIARLGPAHRFDRRRP